MAIPQAPARFADTMDSKEVLEWIFSMAGRLEITDGETIDPAPDQWELTPLVEAVAWGVEIIEGSGTWPDPTLVEGNTAVRAWIQIKPEFVGNAAFLAGVPLPFELTCWTTSTPKRRRQRTFVLTILES